MDRRGLVVWVALIGGAAAVLLALTLMFPGQASGMDQAQALAMIGWLAVASSGLLFARRFHLGEVARNLAVWAVIAGAIVAVYSMRDQIADAAQRVRGALIPGYAAVTADHEITVQAADDGHFYVMGQVNGASVRFVVDTGASDVVLSPQDAARAGVDVAALKYDAPGETANGVGFNAPYLAPQLQIGPIKMTNVVASVNGAPLSTSLLGMTFLSRLESFEFKGDQLVMRWRG